MNKPHYEQVFLALVLISLVASSLGNMAYGQSGHSPNIIVIIPDDMGWADVGYNGSAIKTPNIDKLEQSGIHLNQQYVMTTCTLTRVGLFTSPFQGLMKARY